MNKSSYNNLYLSRTLAGKSVGLATEGVTLGWRGSDIMLLYLLIH